MRSRLAPLFLALLACAGSPAGPGGGPDIPPPPPAPPPPPPPGNQLRVLMLGNSLTYTWDVPGLVAEMAAQAGLVRPHIRSIAEPNFALEDHWEAGAALGTLRAGKYHVVVMQQGPSTLASSGDHLRQWARRWADEARTHGTSPAVYAVWPPAGGNLDAGITHYTLAATESGAALFPVAQAWRLAWADYPRPALYGPDQFHQGPDGAWLAALVIVAMLYDRPVSDFANVMADRIPQEIETVLRRAAKEAIRLYGRPVT